MKQGPKYGQAIDMEKTNTRYCHHNLVVSPDSNDQRSDPRWIQGKSIVSEKIDYAKFSL